MCTVEGQVKAAQIFYLKTNYLIDCVIKPPPSRPVNWLLFSAASNTFLINQSIYGGGGMQQEEEKEKTVPFKAESFFFFFSGTLTHISTFLSNPSFFTLFLTPFTLIRTTRTLWKPHQDKSSYLNGINNDDHHRPTSSAPFQASLINTPTKSAIVTTATTKTTNNNSITYIQHTTQRAAMYDTYHHQAAAAAAQASNSSRSNINNEAADTADSVPAAAATGAANTTLHRQQLQFAQEFWEEQIVAAEQYDSDFKNHPLPLARIKKVMKSDPEVKVQKLLPGQTEWERLIMHRLSPMHFHAWFLCWLLFL